MGSSVSVTKSLGSVVSDKNITCLTAVETGELLFAFSVFRLLTHEAKIDIDALILVGSLTRSGAMARRLLAHFLGQADLPLLLLS
jgi:hypothetical protein